MDEIRRQLPELPTPALYRISGTLERILAGARLTAADYRALESAAASSVGADSKR